MQPATFLPISNFFLQTNDRTKFFKITSCVHKNFEKENNAYSSVMFVMNSKSNTKKSGDDCSIVFQDPSNMFMMIKRVQEMPSCNWWLDKK